MINKLKSKTEGFTIIEVLIVLAIAGLIILIVFLAVPALQRNSRNTSRRNDAARFLAALTEYSNNHNGNFPDPAVAAQVTDYYNSIGNKAFYKAQTDMTYSKGVPTGGTGQTADTAKIFVATNVKCNANGDDFTATGASSRNFAAVIGVETGGTATKVCVES